MFPQPYFENHAVYEIIWKIIVIYKIYRLKLRTHTRYYVIRTLPVL